MALYRNLRVDTWLDPKFASLTDDEKLFFIFSISNPHTNLCGCYEISVDQITNYLNFRKNKIEKLIENMEKTHGFILYSKSTKELLIKNWHKHNWTSSEKFRKPLLKEIQKIKCKEFKEYLLSIYNGEDTVSPICGYGIDTTDADTVSDAVTDTDTIPEAVKEIVGYLNFVCGSKYKCSTKGTIKHINARLNEGYTVDDFKTVIEKKHAEWANDDKMSQYLNPDTLFGTKFEKYFNQKEVRKSNKQNIFEEWSEA